MIKIKNILGGKLEGNLGGKVSELWERILRGKSGGNVGSKLGGKRLG